MAARRGQAITPSRVKKAAKGQNPTAAEIYAHAYTFRERMLLLNAGPRTLLFPSDDSSRSLLSGNNNKGWIYMRRWWRRLVIIMARSNQLQLSCGQYGEWPLYGLYAFIYIRAAACESVTHPWLCVKGVAFYFTHKSSLPISLQCAARTLALYQAFMNVEVYI